MGFSENLKFIVRILSLCFLVLHIAACGSKKGDTRPTDIESSDPEKAAGRSVEESTCLNIVNGKVDTDTYRATALLFSQSSACSGTFISANTMLTAAHCIDNSTTGGVRYVYGNAVASGQEGNAFDSGIVPLKSIHHSGVYGSYVDIGSFTGIQKDLAILIFPNGTAPAATPILGRDTDDGEDVVMAGFGRTEFPEFASGSSVFKRRSGKNTSVIYGGYPGIFVIGATQTTITDGSATNSNVAQGDSGGSLFIDGKLAGVTSAGMIDAQDTSQGETVFVDLNYPDSLTLLQTAREAGADIDFDGSGGEVNSLNPDEDIDDCE